MGRRDVDGGAAGRRQRRRAFLLVTMGQGLWPVQVLDGGGVEEYRVDFEVECIYFGYRVGRVWFLSGVCGCGASSSPAHLIEVAALFHCLWMLDVSGNSRRIIALRELSAANGIRSLRNCDICSSRLAGSKIKHLSEMRPRYSQEPPLRKTVVCVCCR